VANAVKEVKGRVDLITAHEGGRGAVREVTDLLLQAQGQYGEELGRYLA
jgi:3-deoxy-D-manno-octulosonate 8-phosphate phosphatase (KDO 8-P phosphatase)